VQRTLIRPPSSRMGKATLAEREAVLEHDPNRRRYRESIDRESAHEELLRRAEKKQATATEQKKTAKPRKSGSSRQSTGEAFVKSMARSLGSAAGRSLGSKLFRGLLGSLLR